jgi:hypothetical protein
MKTTNFIKLILFISIVYSSASSQTQSNIKNINITVEIDYGKEKPKQIIEVAKANRITALEALQKAATVETHPVSGYVFVTSINNVRAERGKMASYYKVNGKPPKLLAINKELKDGDIISWRFTEDVCSKTVDK